MVRERLFAYSVSLLFLDLTFTSSLTPLQMLLATHQRKAVCKFFSQSTSLPHQGHVVLYQDTKITKWTFMSFFFVFEFGSLLSGVATSSAMLITGRAIAGAGAAGLMSGTLSIVGVVVTLRLRALYTGILSSMFGVATIAGPLLSGVFTQHVSWRWVFLVNLPIGGFIIVVLMFMFQPPTRKVEQDPLKERIRRLDLIGAAMFIPSVIMLLLALQWGGLTYPWNSGRIIGLFVGGGIILIIFSVWQWRTGDVAMIPPPIFTQRSVFWACLCAMFGMGAQMMLGLWIPEWFQAVKGNSPVQSGVHLLPSMLAQTVSAIISGAGITMLGYYNPWVIAGPALMSIACGLFTTWDVNTGSAYWIGYQVIYGLGAGIFITGPIVAVQTVLTPANTPVGISTVTFFQFFGGALFSALSQTIFNEQLLKQLAKNVPGVNVAALLAAGTAALETVATPDQLPGILKSYNRALLDPFYLAAAIDAVSCFCALGLEWVNVKGKNLASGA